ncbi:MAG: hypothetical protein HQL30_12370 [Candidatus Omnitrophica bacterium]|nr:hypothetical protein [Candidatus Omnitrophota bacterium]
MKYIIEDRINELLAEAGRSAAIGIDDILNKSLALKGLSMREAAVLLSCDSEEDTRKLFMAASTVKQRIYGSRVVIFAPFVSGTVRSEYGIKAEKG